MQWALSRFFALTALAVSGFLAGCGGCAGGCGGGGVAPEPAPPVVAPPPAVVMQSFAYVTGNGSDVINIFRIDDAGALVAVDTVQAREGVGLLEVHPSNRFAYVASSGDHVISIFQLDPGTGRLTNRVDVAAPGRAPDQVRVHPSGNFAYVTNFDDGTVSIFDVDTGTGALTVNSAGSVAVGAQPQDIMIDPAGRFLFVQLSQGVASYAIDASGALALISNLDLGVGVSGIALAPSGQFIYAAAVDGTVSKLSIDGLGAVSFSAAFPVGAGAGNQTIYIEPNGRFAYVSNGVDRSVTPFGIHPQTGDLIDGAAAVDAGTSPGLVGMGPAGEFLYAPNADGNLFRYAVNQNTGALTAVGTPFVTDALAVGVVIISLPH